MLILPVKTKMTTFKGTLKYVVLKNLNDIYFLSVNLIAIIILVIISFNAKSLNYDSAYQYFNLYGFFIALSIGKGVISEELSNRHAELIFTKPIKKEIYFLFIYIGCLIMSIITIAGFMLISAITSIYFSSFSLVSFLKVLSYICLNQITIFALLFFISSWAPGSSNSVLLFSLVISYPIIRLLLFSNDPHLENILNILKDIITPFKIDPFINREFSVLKLIYHWFVYPISLLYGTIKIIENKEII